MNRTQVCEAIGAMIREAKALELLAEATNIESFRNLSMAKAEGLKQAADILAGLQAEADNDN